MDNDNKTITIELDRKDLEEKIFNKLKIRFPEVDKEFLRGKAHEIVKDLAGK